MAWPLFFRPQSRLEGRVLCLGVDDAGTRNFLGQFPEKEKTIGFAVKLLTTKRLRLTIFSIQTKTLRLWRFYFENALGLIFFLDAADVDKARADLWALLEEPQLQSIPLLVFVNVRHGQCASAVQVAEQLNLRQLRHHRHWFLQPTSAKRGFQEGLDWLIDTILLMDSDLNYNKTPPICRSLLSGVPSWVMTRHKKNKNP